MGVVGRPHGVRGLVHVTSYTSDPADLARYSPLFDEQGREWRLAWRSDGVAELCGADGIKLADRTAAEKLTNLRLYVPREALPTPDDEEYYLTDLIGLAVRGPDGADLGLVSHIHDYGAGASLEIATNEGASLLVPFTKAAVPTVDLAARVVQVLPPDEIIVEAEAS
jgi:16S rRNA processing protein RimM